ncbi:hypothetical protein ACJX0J_021554, partial [Zea mays]
MHPHPIVERCQIQRLNRKHPVGGQVPLLMNVSVNLWGTLGTSHAAINLSFIVCQL